MDPELTQLLVRAGEGDARAVDAILPIVYEQLRRSAGKAMQAERRDHTLQATALVHEVYVRLLGESPEGGWQGRAQFYHAAGRAMRQLLIEHARSKARLKRGGDGQGRRAGKVPLDLVDLAAEGSSEEILALEEAVRHLEEQDPETAAVVRLRFFAGLSGDQAAEALGISPRQVDRLWSYARAVIFQRVSQGDDV